MTRFRRRDRRAGAVLMLLAAAAIAPAVGAAADAALNLRPDWVLRTDADYVIWSVDGVTRVPHTGYEQPQQVWRGADLRPVEADAFVDGLTYDGPTTEAISLAAAANEYEPFQVVITPRTDKSLTIGEVTVSDLVTEAGERIASDEIETHLVGYIWGVDPETGEKTCGPIPDVLFGEGEWAQAAPGRNYNLWFIVHVPPGTAGGAYRGTVSIPIDGRTVELPVRLRVWDFDLPKQTPVNTQLFNYHGYAFCWYYNVADWEDRFAELLGTWADEMAKRRLSPSPVPWRPRPKFETFPGQRDGGPFGKYLAFRGNKLRLGGVDDYHLRNGFTVCTWVRTHVDHRAAVHRHDWLGRSAGYRIVIEDGEVRGQVGLGHRDGPNATGLASPDTTSFETVSAPWRKQGEWRHVAMTYEPGRLRLYLDGELVDENSGFSGYYLPALGALSNGALKIGAHELDADEQFDVDELRWADRVLSAAEITEEMDAADPKYARYQAYDFEGDKYDFTSRAQSGDPDELDAQWFWRAVDFLETNGLFVNNILPNLRDAVKAGDVARMKQLAAKYIAPLRERELLQYAYMRLPFDEAHTPKMVQKNVEAAKLLDEHMPGLPRHQTVPAGTRVVQEHYAPDLSLHRAGLKLLRDYEGYVDIWATHPHRFKRYYDEFFRDRLERGDQICVYINPVQNIEQPFALAAARSFPWQMWRYRFIALNHWGITLWSQAAKDRGRHPGRRTWRVEQGFHTIDRNPQINAATLFWPGEDRVLPSLATENWRDGIEDYAYFQVLERTVDKADQAGVQGEVLEDARQLLAEMREIEWMNGTYWHTLPTKDASRIMAYRERVAASLENLKHAMSESALSQRPQPWQRRDEPVLSALTTDQAWASTQFYSPHVIRDGDKYKMWYIGSGDRTRRADMEVGYAESEDGIHWAEYENNPILTLDDLPWGAFWQTPYVLYDEQEQIYKMWFTGVTDVVTRADGRLTSAVQKLGYATSKDGIHWDVHPEPIFNSGRRPSVIKEGPGRYRMWMNCGRLKPDGSRGAVLQRIYEFTSTDGLHWTISDQPVLRPSGEQRTVIYPYVIREHGRYYMWYGSHVGGFELFCAESPDGVNWEPHSDTPAFPAASDPQRFDSRYTSIPCVVVEDDRYLLYYAARDLSDEYVDAEGKTQRDGGGVYRHIGLAIGPRTQTP